MCSMPRIRHGNPRENGAKYWGIIVPNRSCSADKAVPLALQTRCFHGKKVRCAPPDSFVETIHCVKVDTLLIAVAPSAFSRFLLSCTNGQAHSFQYFVTLSRASLSREETGLAKDRAVIVRTIVPISCIWTRRMVSTS